jgi:hypothetical protein
MNETEIQWALVSKLIDSTIQSIRSDKLLHEKELIPNLSLSILISSTIYSLSQRLAE